MPARTNYLDFLDAVKSYYGTGSDEWVKISKYGLKADNAIEILKQVPGVDILKNTDGSIRSIAYNNFSTKGNKSTFLAESIDSNVYGGTANVKNSFNLKVPSNTTVKTGDVLEMGSEIGKKTTGQKVIGALGTIGQAVFAVTCATTLGKVIDSALYNANPDFWNAHDMETLDPSTWASITNGGTIGENAFNLLMGIDPDTNETTGYIDENAFAYMAWYLNTKGIFGNSAQSKVDAETIKQYASNDLKNALKSDINTSVTSFSYITPNSPNVSKAVQSTSIPTFQYVLANEDLSSGFLQRTSLIQYLYKQGETYQSPSPTDFIPNVSQSPTEYNNDIFYMGGYGPKNMNYCTATVPIIKLSNTALSTELNWLIVKHSKIESIIDGVNTQPNATTPNLSNVNSVSDALNALKTQYPDLFANAITNSVPQEDGSIKNYTYVPVSLPNTNNANDAEPTTGEQTQAKPKVDPKTSPDSLLDLITNLLNNKLNTPNTPNKGNGSTPSTKPPVGSASALYKIYNPSQEQLDSFGQWLWSSSFVDQLLKVFNNPMESIIGLHKVYASPTIGGQTNIKVGYLDSGVSSNFVSNQYTKIDCGTVNLREYFGNVFDYSPYTNIQLYLPCIGFVNLNVGDVMRSQINIVYTVDVLTGACLAEVNVIRDGGGGVLYSYSGNCASQYPLSSGSYMGIVSSAIGVAGSIIGTVASGGSLAPLALGSLGAVMNAHTNVQHSGNLSGNSGVMGGKIPYLIITRPQTNMPNNYEHYQGLPSNFYTSLSSCNGFTKVKNVDVSNINADSNELDKIKSLLMEGVII